MVAKVDVCSMRGCGTGTLPPDIYSYEWLVAYNTVARLCYMSMRLSPVVCQCLIMLLRMSIVVAQWMMSNMSI